MFDKNEQRRRAAQLDAERQANGLIAPKLEPIKTHTTQPITAVQQVIKKAKMKKVNYEVIPFTNDIGQVIQPGQSIVCVSQGYNHSIKVSKGVFLGVRLNSRGVASVVVQRIMEGYGYFLPDGTKASYGKPGAKYGKGKWSSRSSLPRKRIYALA